LVAFSVFGGFEPLDAVLGLGESLGLMGLIGWFGGWALLWL
jgi:hypothetical protein